MRVYTKPKNEAMLWNERNLSREHRQKLHIIDYARLRLKADEVVVDAITCENIDILEYHAEWSRNIDVIKALAERQIPSVLALLASNWGTEPITLAYIYRVATPGEITRNIASNENTPELTLKACLNSSDSLTRKLAFNNYSCPWEFKRQFDHKDMTDWNKENE